MDINSLIGKDHPSSDSYATKPTPEAAVADQITAASAPPADEGGAEEDKDSGPAAQARWRDYIYRAELPDEELAPTRKVLVEYSSVAAEDVDAHIRRIVRSSLTIPYLPSMPPRHHKFLGASPQTPYPRFAGSLYPPEITHTRPANPRLHPSPDAT
jgi:hypothetical protein